MGKKGGMIDPKVRERQRMQKPLAFGFKPQGFAKKVSSLSVGQLRTMFPDLMALPDEALKREATKRLLERR